ncbi:MAG: galactokinase [Lachnospiraceae bacterium]|nr:galactokinase [Lachnospiraceae bacterium]
MGIVEDLKKEFTERFGSEGDIRTYFAPGRVNLIGEHTDYNGGHVFPCALTMGNYAVARKRDDDRIRWFNMTYPGDGVQERSIRDLKPNDNGLWYDYQLGVIWALEEKGHTIPSGFDMVMKADLPAGSGLSASASIEELCAVICRDLYLPEISLVDCALVGQYSENKYNGMNCGIMDQFASAMGKKDHAIFLDTATLEYDYVPLNLKNEKIVIINSCVKHSLAGSAYNDRRRDCENALKDIQAVKNMKTLGDLSEEEYEEVKDAIRDETCKRRARHAVLENIRTIKAVDALKKGDLSTFGELMKASHISLRDDYEVSCEELDILAEEAWKLDGCIGSRMTGGGFGGCTVSIVKEEALEDFKKTISEVYRKRSGKDCEIYIADAADGAGRID